MNKITVDGTPYSLPEGNITIDGDKVFVDGVRFKPDQIQLFSEVKIIWEGPLANLTVKGKNVKVTCGDVSGDVACDGSVKCGEVEGKVTSGGSAKVAGNIGKSLRADGSVTCGDVGDDVRAGGSVTAGKVAGSIKAGGSVSCRR